MPLTTKRIHGDTIIFDHTNGNGKNVNLVNFGEGHLNFENEITMDNTWKFKIINGDLCFQKLVDNVWTTKFVISSQ